MSGTSIIAQIITSLSLTWRYQIIVTAVIFRKTICEVYDTEKILI